MLFDKTFFLLLILFVLTVASQSFDDDDNVLFIGASSRDEFDYETTRDISEGKAAGIFYNTKEPLYGNHCGKKFDPQNNNLPAINAIDQVCKEKNWCNQQFAVRGNQNFCFFKFLVDEDCFCVNVALGQFRYILRNQRVGIAATLMLGKLMQFNNYHGCACRQSDRFCSKIMVYNVFRKGNSCHKTCVRWE